MKGKIISYILLLASLLGIIYIIIDLQKVPMVVIQERCTTNYIEVPKPKEFDVLYDKTVRLLKLKECLTSRVNKNLSNIIVSVITNAYQFKIDPELVLSIIYCESEFNVYSHNSYGATGLMQVCPRFMEYELSQNHWKKSDCFDIDVNIFLGVQQLRQFLVIDRGDLGRAIYRYNGCKIRRVNSKILTIPEESYLHLIKMMNVYYWYKNN